MLGNFEWIKKSPKKAKDEKSLYKQSGSPHGLLISRCSQQISTESQTVLIHHPSVTTKHDKQSGIAAGGDLKRSSNVLFWLPERSVDSAFEKTSSNSSSFLRSIMKVYLPRNQNVDNSKLPKRYMSMLRFLMIFSLPNWPCTSPGLWQTNKQQFFIVHRSAFVLCTHNIMLHLHCWLNNISSRIVFFQKCVPISLAQSEALVSKCIHRKLGFLFDSVEIVTVWEWWASAVPFIIIPHPFLIKSLWC